MVVNPVHCFLHHNVVQKTVFCNDTSARVESLGTALASTTLQAKPAWARVKAKQVPQCI